MGKYEFSEQEKQTLFEILNIASLHPVHGGLKISKVCNYFLNKLSAENDEPKVEKKNNEKK